MYKDIFISYSSKDTKIVEYIVELFKKNNILYWFAPEQLVGKKHDEAIVPAIKNCKIFLIFLSKHSRPRDGYETSEWVRDELLTAREYGCCILPIKLDETVDLETNNLMFKGLPNYLDISQGNIVDNMEILKSVIDHLLLDDNYKHKKIEVLQKVEEKQKKLIKEIENNLKNGFWNIAEKIINENRLFESLDSNYIVLLNCIVQLSKKPIKDMHVNDLKLIVDDLHRLRGTEYTNISYYLESMISKSYFTFNAIRDNLTDGYENLKRLSKKEPKIRAKYHLMCKNIKNTISNERYALQW